MRKYDLFMVKVIVDGVETVVKTNRDSTSYSEMKELYSKTIKKVEHGNVLLIGINSSGYTTIYSKHIEKEAEEMDVVVSNLIDNINYIVKYAENAGMLQSSVDMTRDVYLKNIELFDEFELDDEDENRRVKEEIFDELKEILKLRRKVKYNTLLAKKIVEHANLLKVLKRINTSKRAMKYNSSVNVSKQGIVKQDEYSIKDFFNLDTINTISQMKKENDKILVMEDKIIGYNKSSKKPNNKISKKQDLSSVSRDTKHTFNARPVLQSEPDKIIVNPVKSSIDDFIVGEIVYKCPELKDISGNTVCVEQKEYISVKDNHLEGFIKNKSNKFNLITTSESKVYCYRFEDKNELKYFDKDNFEKLEIKNIDDVFGDVLMKNSKIDFNNSNLVCVEKRMYDNIQDEHLDKFIKNKSSYFNLITKKKRFIYCYRFKKVANDEFKRLAS